MARSRLMTIAPPQEMGRHDGLAYALFRPPGPTTGGVVILHGAGSCKESHFDFARAVRAQGIAAVAFDQRGHGDSSGRLDGRALSDVATMSALLGPGPVALRGSSMGGFLALAAARDVRPRAVVAICPAEAGQLRRALRRGELDCAADEPALTRVLEAHEATDAVATLDTALLLMHAEGDERVPAEHSRRLMAAARTPEKRLVIVPGGHHRSVQHDPELQAYSVRFIARALAGKPPLGRAPEGPGALA